MSDEIDIKVCNNCLRKYASEQDYLNKTSRWRVCSSGHLWFNCSCNSTLLIKRGRFPWYSPGLSLGPDSLSVFNRLGGLKGLPHIPSIAMQLLQLLQKTPQVEPGEVARVMRQEPVLSLRVLSMAEAIRNARSEGTARFNSLEHAIVYLGFGALKELVVTASLHSIPTGDSAFKADVFWRESSLTGAIAEVLMQRFAPQLDKEQVFLAGSLCNVGKMVQAICFPALVTKISVDVADNSKVLSTWSQAELSYGFPDHCILGEIAASLWGFPVEIIQSVRGHHTIHSGVTSPFTVSEIGAAANQMLHWVLLRPHRMEHDLLKNFTTRAKISESDLSVLAADLTKLAKAIASSNASIAAAT